MRLQSLLDSHLLSSFTGTGLPLFLSLLSLFCALSQSLDDPRSLSVTNNGTTHEAIQRDPKRISESGDSRCLGHPLLLHVRNCIRRICDRSDFPRAVREVD